MPETTVERPCAACGGTGFRPGADMIDRLTGYGACTVCGGSGKIVERVRYGSSGSSSSDGTAGCVGLVVLGVLVSFGIAIIVVAILAYAIVKTLYSQLSTERGRSDAGKFVVVLGMLAIVLPTEVFVINPSYVSGILWSVGIQGALFDQISAWRYGLVVFLIPAFGLLYWGGSRHDWFGATWKTIQNLAVDLANGIAEGARTVIGWF